jgi:hypothetical protein
VADAGTRRERALRRKKPTVTVGWVKSGEPGWDRTIDTLIKSQVLYR